MTSWTPAFQVLVAVGPLSTPEYFPESLPGVAGVLVASRVRPAQ